MIVFLRFFFAFKAFLSVVALLKCLSYFLKKKTNNESKNRIVYKQHYDAIYFKNETN